MVTLSLMLAAAAAGPIPDVGPVRAAVSATDLVETADISGLSLSPDGRRVAYRVSRPSVSANAIALDWYVAPVAGGLPIRIGSGGAARHGGAGTLLETLPLWDADSQGLRFLALADGAVGVWHWRNGSDPAPEILSDADILDFGPADDGAAIRYTIGATRAGIAAAERNAYDQGTLVDHRLDPMEPLAGGTIENGKRIMMRLPGAWFTRERILSETPRQGLTVAVASRAAIALAAQGDRAEAADGSRADIVMGTDEHAVMVARPDGKRIACRAAPCRSARLAALAWRPDHDMLLLFERAGSAREHVWLWRVGAPKARLLTTTDGGTRSPSHPPRCVAAAVSLVCAEAGPVSPPRIVSIGYARAEKRVIDDPNAALRRRIAAKAEPMQWPRGVTGVLLLPKKTAGPLPLVIHHYRCPGFLRGGIGDEIPMLPLVEHGFAVLCMDRVRAPKDAGTDASYAAALSDIEGALDGLVKDGVVDPARVGIGGLSFGSEVALYAVRKSDRFAAATLSSSQMSPSYYWANALPGRAFAAMLDEYWRIGDPDSDPARWKQLSAIYDIGSIRTPLLMQLPESEARYVLELHTKLKLAGKPAELFAFADEPHIKKQPVHKRAVYERNLDWYRFWLKGEEDADPAKAEQYARWRSYRVARIAKKAPP